MTHEDVNQIERELGVTVPPDYRAFVTEFPADLPAVVRGYEILDHPVYVIGDNESAREGPLWGVQWPEHYFVIGHDGSGGLYALDTQRSPSPVIYFDHEDRSFRELAASLRDWVPQLIEVYAD